MIILDASVLIGHFEATDHHHTRATELLIKYHHHEFAASTITLAEFYVGAARAGQAEAARRALTELHVEAQGVNPDAGWRLAELRAQTNLKLPDCCVLYTAEQHTAPIATFDARLSGQAVQLGLAIAD
jgi:predicted nucleic acid-binding protein